MFRTLTEIIESGYCMGCGLCRHYAPDAAEMLIADSGQMLPTIAQDLTAEENAEIVRLCPGVLLDAPLREDKPPKHAYAFGDAGRLQRQIHEERVAVLRAFHTEVATKAFPYASTNIGMRHGEKAKFLEALDRWRPIHE